MLISLKMGGLPPAYVVLSLDGIGMLWQAVLSKSGVGEDGAGFLGSVRMHHHPPRPSRGIQQSMGELQPARSLLLLQARDAPFLEQRLDHRRLLLIPHESHLDQVVHSVPPFQVAW